MEQTKLLNLMENNARITVKDLALLLDEDESIVSSQIKELEDNHIIAGYHTIINWDKANQDEVQAIIEVNCVPQRDVGYDHIASMIYQYPEVDTMYLVSGRTEFVIIINGRTMREVAGFVARKLAPIDGVKSTETMFVLKKYKLTGTALEASYEDADRLLVTP
jgi:DNA-binding Lrp family transcriptional regulator